MQKKRRPLLASFLNAINPGLGFLYLGKLRLAIGFPLLFMLVVALAAWSRIILLPTGFSLLVAFLLALWACSMVLAFILAKRAGVAELGRLQTWYGYLGFFVISSLLFSVVLDNRSKIFGYETFSLPTASMSDTLRHGDFIIADTWAFKSRDPERGEVVIFRLPGDPSIKYAKRVIGLPGDTVEIRGGRVNVNGQTLSESYVLPENNQRLSYERPGSYQLPDDAFFLMGDNRDNSLDSRFWGFVPRANLHGSVVFIWFSSGPEQGVRWDRIGLRISTENAPST